MPVTFELLEKFLGETVLGVSGREIDENGNETFYICFKNGYDLVITGRDLSLKKSWWPSNQEEPVGN